MSGLQTAFNKISADEKKQVFQKLVHEVQDNLESIPSVRSLAVRTGVSERLCDMLFQEYLQTSSTRYIKEYRLEKACQLLVQTNKSVAEISRECGMTCSYFSRRIREETGFTPLAYRRTYYRNQAEKE